MELPKQHRHSKQREIILEELRKLPTHPSAATLYEVVRQRLPKISLGTVYRNLDLLARAGLVQKLNNGTQEARYDGVMDHHHHVCCVQCGRVDDVHDDLAEVFDCNRKTLEGYEVLGHQLQFLGICPDCKATNAQGSN